MTIAQPISILCVGDIMLDRWQLGDSTRLSPEAPVPVVALERGSASLGGVGNAARNIHTMGANVSVLSVIGDDSPGQSVLKKVARISPDTSTLLVDPQRPTTTKTRIFAKNTYMLRSDRESTASLSEEMQRRVVESFRKMIDQQDIVVISDYAKGVCTPELIREIVDIARERGKRVLIDPKGKNWDKYKGSFLIKPNLKEFCDIAGFDTVPDEETLIRKAREVKQQYNIENLLITRADKPSLLIAQDDQAHVIPTPAIKAVDVTGAGDTHLATMAVGLAQGMSVADAATNANQKAAKKVTQQGTGCVSWTAKAASSLTEFQQTSFQSDELPALLKRVERWKTEGRTIGVTNGCFDLFHPGHANLLADAKEHCDILIVAINTDDSVKRLGKGDDRPIVNQSNRLAMIAQNRHVDAAILFDESTPEALLHAIRPNVLIKGGDYKADEVVGADFMNSTGGRVVISPHSGISTSQIVDRIRRSGPKDISH